ncbi:hypothetical protein QOT17_005947 [Balamuthia mandrillaris]
MRGVLSFRGAGLPGRLPSSAAFGPVLAPSCQRGVSLSLRFKGTVSAAAGSAQSSSSSSADNTTYQSPLFDHRRLRDRALHQPDPPFDPDYFDLDNDRLGDIEQLNWTFTRYNVIPTNLAYRNLHLRALKMFSQMRFDKDKNLVAPVEEGNVSHHMSADFSRLPEMLKARVPTPPNAPMQGFMMPETKEEIIAARRKACPPPVLEVPPDYLAVPNHIPKLQLQHFPKVFREVRRHLSAASHIFMHDGTIGSSPVAERKVRFITDSAETAWLLRNTIPRVKLGNPFAFDEDIVVFIASNLKLKEPESFQLKGSNFSFISVERNAVILGGTQDANSIQQAVASLAHYQLLKHREAVPLPCESVLDSNSGKCALVFSPPQEPNLALQTGLSNIFGAHGNSWTNYGLSHLFSGVTYPNASNIQLQSSDFIQSKQGSGQRIVTRILQSPNLGPHPSSIIFLTTGGKNQLTKITKEDASKRYLEACAATPLPLKPETLSSAFGKMLDESKATTYSLSVNAKISQDQLQNLVNGSFSS